MCMENITCCSSTLLNNANKVESIFGKAFLEKSIEDRLSIAECLNANEHIANMLYGSELASLLKNRDLTKIGNLYRDLTEEVLTPKAKELAAIDLDEIGIVLIRPETVKSKEDYICFLRQLKFDIILSKKVVLDFKRYWLLYHHGLIRDDTLFEFPTRTFNYVLNDCHLLVLKKSDINLSADSASTILGRYKGREGMYAPETFRGIAFDLLKKYVVSTNKFSEQANIVLDPIGMYRLITRSLVWSDCRHENATEPLLLFAAQGVHIPNDDEINKDLSILCDSRDIQEIRTHVKRLVI